MLYIERREKILEMLRKSGNVKVSDLVDIFHVDADNHKKRFKSTGRLMKKLRWYMDVRTTLMKVTMAHRG